MKTGILVAIGESKLRPAARLNAALAANDRVPGIRGAGNSFAGISVLDGPVRLPVARSAV